MQKCRPALFRRRHFQDHVIVLCVRWYLRYCLTLRDLEELMIETGPDGGPFHDWPLGAAVFAGATEAGSSADPTTEWILAGG